MSRFAPGASSMRKITVAFLWAAYLCLGLTVAVLLWRSGGGWGAGLSGLIGAIGLAFALHGVISRSLDRAQLSAEVAAVREANILLLRQVEAIQGAIGALGYNTDLDAARRSEALTGEVRMLEALVQRMGDTLDERLSQLQTGAPVIAAAARSPPCRASAAAGPRPPSCWKRCARPSPPIASTSICSRWSACRSAAPCSTRASRACATRAAA